MAGKFKLEFKSRLQEIFAQTVRYFEKAVRLMEGLSAQKDVFGDQHPRVKRREVYLSLSRFREEVFPMNLGWYFYQKQKALFYSLFYLLQAMNVDGKTRQRDVDKVIRIFEQELGRKLDLAHKDSREAWLMARRAVIDYMLKYYTFLYQKRDYLRVSGQSYLSGSDFYSHALHPVCFSDLSFWSSPESGVCRPLRISSPP